MTSKTSFYAQSGATPTEQAAIESSVNTSAASAAAAVISATSAAQSATLATSNIAANQASAAASEASRVASVAAQAASETAKTASETAQAAALVSKNAASTSATNAASSETTVSNNTATSTTKAAEAAASATASEASKVTSVASASTATTKASESSTSATNSASSATASEASRVASVAAKTASETAETNAETAESAALVSKNAAASSATASEASKVTSVASAATATTKASEASTSASNAATSASSASTSASTATTKAADSETARAASVVAKDASVVAKNSSVVAKDASVAAQAAAETAETNAETAETNSASSATASANSATASANSATASEASKVTSVNSASAASTSETNAASSAASAAATYDAFDDRFLGAKSSAPTQDNDGLTLAIGTMYFDTTAQIMKVYGSSGWQSAGSAVNGTAARFKFVATANQTTFSGNDASSNSLAYDAGFLDVYLSGIKLVNGTDFTASSGTSIVLASGVAVNEILEIIAYGTFVLANFNADKLDGQHGAYYTSYTDTAVAALVDSSPATLNTLNELAASLGDDPNFATTVTNSIATKAALAGAAFTGAITTNSTFDGRDVATDGTKLDGIEASADVTDTANVTSAGALMDSELTSIVAVKALNQGVATTNSPTFAALTSTGEITANGGIALGDHDKATFGAGDDLQIYHDAYHSYIKEIGAGSLILDGANILFRNADASKSYASMTDGGAIDLYHNNALKLSTQSTGINVVGTAAMDGLTVGDTSSGQSLIQMFANPTNGANTIHFGDGASANAYVGYINYAHDSNSMQFAVGNGEKMRIDSSGAIGFKKIPPSGSHTSWSQFFIGEKGTLISESSNSGGLYGTWLTDNMYIKQSTGAFANVTADQSSAYKQEAGIHQWFSQTSGSANAAITLVEHMRLSGGNLLLGTQGNTPSGGNAKQYNLATGTTVGLAVSVNNTGYSLLNLFYNNTTLVGAITTNGSATAYNTSSDYRLKENVVPMTGSIDRVKALKPSRFNFIVDSDTTVDGFLAHEAQEVVPECATGTKDAMVDEEYEVTAAVEEVRDEDYNITTEAVEAVMGTRSVPDMQGIDQAKLVPLLTAALQEAINRIESLEARLSALENN